MDREYSKVSSNRIGENTEKSQRREVQKEQARNKHQKQQESKEGIRKNQLVHEQKGGQTASKSKEAKLKRE